MLLGTLHYLSNSGQRQSYAWEEGAGKAPAARRAARIVQAAFTPWERPVPTATPLAIHFLLL